MAGVVKSTGTRERTAIAERRAPDGVRRELPPAWVLRWIRRSQSVSSQGRWTRFALATALGLSAVLLKAVVESSLGATTGFLSYVAAVVLAAWLAGLGGGLIAAGIAVAAQALIFDAPAGLLMTPAGIVRMVWFLADGVLLSVVTAGLGRLFVTEQKARQAATDLVGAVSRFKGAVDTSPDAVLMFQADTLRVTYANQSAAELAGTTQEAWIGRSVVEIQLATTEAAFREQLQPLTDGAVETVRYASVAGRLNGPKVPFEATIQRLRTDDGSDSLVLSARDITDRIEVQARLARVAGDERRQAGELRTVLEAMGEGVLVVDGEGQIRMTNAAAVAMFGRAPQHWADVARLLGLNAADVPALGQPSEARVVQTTDGRWFEIANHAVEPTTVGPSRDGSTILALRDVTKAHAAQQAREAFIGVLSHELRTPVTTIYGYAKVFRRPQRAHSQAEMLVEIEREADRLYRIVEDLLALSRVEGGLTIDAEPLLFQHLAAPVMASEAARWPRTRFEVELPPDLPAVFGDRTYVEQVLRNLLSNAAKYSPPDSPVTLTAETTPTHVEVRVLDRGLGITSEEAERLFQLYYRSPRTAGAATGAGIGLFVSRSLVDAMGGRMWAAPRDGGGADFGFSLRRCDEDLPTLSMG